MNRTDCIESGQHGLLLTANVHHEHDADEADCPEWCGHEGQCAEWRNGLYAFEAAAEGAWLVAAESAAMDEDYAEREREAMDVGLQAMREEREMAEAHEGHGGAAGSFRDEGCTLCPDERRESTLEAAIRFAEATMQCVRDPQRRAQAEARLFELRNARWIAR